MAQRLLVPSMNETTAETHVRTVLVVDDSRDYVEALCWLLQELTRWRAAPVCTIAEAIEHIEHQRPDAVLLDLQMPPSSGFHFLDVLSATFKERLPAVYVVSGNAELLDRARGDQRVKAAAIKPADPESLAEWLNAMPTS